MGKKKNNMEDWWEELTAQEQAELDEAFDASFNKTNWVSNKKAKQLIKHCLAPKNRRIKHNKVVR